MKDLNMCVLLDFYSSLLTEKQAEMMSMYYNDDLSLSEIAEGMNITRQGVRDAVKKAEQILNRAESEMGYAERFIVMARELGTLRAQTEELIKNQEDVGLGLEKLLRQIDKVRALSGVADYGI